MLEGKNSHTPFDVDSELWHLTINVSAVGWTIPLTRAWKTLAYQEVILRIGPLGKLGRFESTANFFVYIASIGIVSGPIPSITSRYA